MKLDAKNLYYLLCGLVVVAILALGACVYLATGFLKEKSKGVHDARLKTAVLEQREAALRKAKADIEKYKGLAEIAKSIVPQDKDQALISAYTSGNSFYLLPHKYRSKITISTTLFNVTTVTVNLGVV